MAANDVLRREKVMNLIHAKLEDRKHQFGCKTAQRMIPDVIEEVSESEFYTYKTLERYYNDWIHKKGKFSVQNTEKFRK